MKRWINVITPWAIAVVVIAAAYASAAPGKPFEEPSPTPSVSPSESPSAEPTESASSEPAESESPGTAPDFSLCEGLTGLDNAICRHEALLVVHPENPGLANSLAHLQLNKFEQEARGSDEVGDDGTTSDDTTDGTTTHGHSGEPHGNGNAVGHSH